MKILGGRYKGLTIDTSKNILYRPTQTRIRKSIFDILAPFTYSRVLDLYSGSGILGFESASRGAESITFVDNNSASIKMLNRNKTKFDSPEFFVIRKKVFSYLKGLNDNYDLIFADPPYDKLDYSLLINMCIEKLS
ncbi:MAG: RsmD family RNA methyltransferase, partial [Candidatus Neomarinimicrobiota bacterium]|nr:RsmD family RNA methyltransferase [Candidatus Neomarinimicrobiota bacterium]